MKLISLNTWGGRAGKKELFDFFKKHNDVDVLCLQEVWNGGEHVDGKIAGGMELHDIAYRMFDELKEVLPEHEAFFRPHFGDWYGLALFIKKDIPLLEEGELFVYKEKGYMPEGDWGNHARNIQYVTFETAKGPRTVVNFHGQWNGQGKTDTDERIQQSDNIRTFLRSLTNPFVLCGDFNLLPTTQSLKMLEKEGLRNLITENGITSTRSRHHTKADKFADYALVSEGIRVDDFKVLQEHISDHLPLYLEFE